jgi:hypothetical protein
MKMRLSTSAPVNVFGLEEFTATTSARNHFHSRGSAMTFHVARAAKGEAVRHINPKIREL